MPVFDRACVGLSAAAALGVLVEAWLHDPIPDEDAELGRRLHPLPRILAPHHLAQLDVDGYCVVQLATTSPQVGGSSAGNGSASCICEDGTRASSNSRSSSDQSCSGRGGPGGVFGGTPLWSLAAVNGARRGASALVDARRLEDTGNAEV